MMSRRETGSTYGKLGMIILACISWPIGERGGGDV